MRTWTRQAPRRFWDRIDVSYLTLSSKSLRLSFWLEQNARELMTEQFKMDEMHQLVANDMPLALMKELHGCLYKGQLMRNGPLGSAFEPFSSLK